VVRAVFEQLTQPGVWVRAHPQEAAKILSPVWGLDVPTIERANARRSYRVRAIEARHFGER